ncbi:MAG: stage II sporulation protein P [Clostridia bacterium]|nr:stage II sporulation protein P [Clostridia bacterium]
MKKDMISGIIIIALIAIMGTALKSSGSFAKSAAKQAVFFEMPILRLAEAKQLYVEDESEDSEIKIEIGGYSSPAAVKSKGRVLIYHTHITEAYAKTDSYFYEDSGENRTEDKEKNVARIGKELALILEKDYGIEVVHDTTNFEPPKLGTSYNRSLAMIEKRNKEKPFDIYLDIHRDSFAYNPGETITINGKSAARIMVVIGTGEGNNGTPILPKPDYKANYLYAKQLTDNINSQVKGLAKEVRVNKSRYNQHVSNRAVLIEMGYTGNNMDEALASVPYLAKAIADTIQ